MPKVDNLLSTDLPKALKGMAFLLAILALFHFSPYFLWSEYIIFDRVTNGISIFIMLIVVFNYYRSTIFNLELVIIYSIFSVFAMAAGTEESKISYVPLVTILFIALKPEMQYLVFKYIFRITAILMAIGLVSYILQLVGLNVVLGQAISPNKFKAPYNVFFGHVEETLLPVYRFSSIFDEAGLVGTLCALLLSAVKFSIKDKYSVILILTGLISFSLAFYIIMFINMIFSLNVKKAISIFLLLATLFVVANDKLYYLIGSRLSVKHGTIAGDNRSHEKFEVFYKDFVSKGGIDLYFGKGVGWANQQKVSQNVASYKLIVIDLGIIGILLIIIFYSSSVYLIGNLKSGWILCLVFLFSAYQRPDLTSYNAIALFIGGLRYLQYNNKLENDQAVCLII